MLRKRLRERHIQTTCMEKLATAIAPKPILSIVVFANLTDRGISPIIEQKIWDVKEIFGLTYEFSHNLVSHVGMYTNEKKRNCVPCRFVRGVHQGQFTTISFKHSLLPWLLMYKEEGFLRSSRSWFIFFVNDSVSGTVKEVAFGRLSLPIFYFFTQCFLVVIAILHC